MENRNSKVIALVALIVAVVGLGIGFAAFSSTLTISSSATVTPNSGDFKVAFDGNVTCTGSATGGTVDNATEGVSTVSGITATFTQPGETAECTVTAKNSGQYTAYLKSITSDKVTCEAVDNANNTATTATLMNAACDTVTVTTEVGSATASATTAAGMAGSFSQSLASTASDTVTFTITYNGPARADGNFKINVPQVTLVYSSVQ